MKALLGPVLSQFFISSKWRILASIWASWSLPLQIKSTWKLRKLPVSDLLLRVLIFYLRWLNTT
jgi:hypothetical protein